MQRVFLESNSHLKGMKHVRAIIISPSLLSIFNIFSSGLRVQWHFSNANLINDYLSSIVMR